MSKEAVLTMKQKPAPYADPIEQRPQSGEYDDMRPGRPDQFAHMKRAHEADAYDARFKAEVGAALKEADDPAAKWVSHAEVMADLDERIARYEKAIAEIAK